jgi:hypothetical protein
MNEATHKSVFEDFIQSAREACGEMERFDPDNTRPLLSALIRLLHDADRLARSPVNLSDNDVNGEVALPEALSSLPDDLVFQVVFDPLSPESVCAVSLRDSLGDIYQSLKSGLDVLDQNGKNKDAVFWQWKLDYETHWGRHLLDVIRFLFLCPRESVDK